MSKNLTGILFPLLLLVSILSLSACGGGGSSSEKGSSETEGSETGNNEPESNETPSATNNAPHISGTVGLALENTEFNFSPLITDEDNDSLTLTIENKPNWLSFNSSTGKLTGTPSATDIGVASNIKISVNDGKTSADLVFSITTHYSPIEEALRTGNALIVETSKTLLDETLLTIEDNQTRHLEHKYQLFNLNSDGSTKLDNSSLTDLMWDPTHDAALLNSTYGMNDTVLTSNAVFVEGYSVQNRSLAIIGEQQNSNASTSRYMVMGSNPMRTWHRGFDINEQMHSFVENSLTWITHGKDLKNESFSMVIAQLDDSYYFPDDTAVRRWFDEHYGEKVSYNEKDVCDGNLLATCLSANPDILVISQQLNDGENVSAIASTVSTAMENGIAVLYLHLNGNHTNLGKALFPLFNVGYSGDNYWQKLGLKDYDPSANITSLPENISAINRMLSHLSNQDYSLDLSTCDASCSNVEGFSSEFKEGANSVQSMMNTFDEGKINLFSNKGYRFQKLLALSADHLRQSITYPMDKTTSNTNAFLTSLFTDHSIYNYRTVNPVQPDMGNFSRSDFSHITPTNKTVELTSKQSFRSAGVYALPGQTFTVTRIDNSAVDTTVFINTLRSGATHEFENNGYNRPKYLKSPQIPIEIGETLTITSPYGGPIQIGFGANDIDVSFTFTEIGLHPYWSGTEDNTSFQNAITKGDYDWTELVTSGFEVHSTLEKMRQSMADDNWDSAASLAAAAMRYTNNFPLVLAGYQGPGIDVVAEIHDFAASKGWTLNSIDQVKHMNADQATCGYGCSGNPYDAYWSFNPVGHGDIHEVGHGLEKSRFRFSGWEGHASTNPYSYYSKTQFYKDTGNDPSCQSLPFESLFNTLQESVGQADPVAYMQAANLTGWSSGVAIYIQMMMSAQAEGVLVDGWHLLARLHTLEREFGRADNSEALWLEKRTSLGFDQFDLTEAKALSNNDWLAIAISFVVQRDMRDYLTMWGLTFGNAAANQVASFGFSVMPKKYHVSNGTDYCYGLNKPALAIDGIQVWPL